MEPFLGQIQMFGFNFAPRGWAFCDGNILPIAQNSALFSLLGTTYGGDGRTSFALPNLQCRFPRHVGSASGIDDVTWGEVGGSHTHTLTPGQLPGHTHEVPVTAEVGTESSPVGNVPATANDGESNYAPSGGMGQVAQQTGSVGSNQAVNHLPPYLGIHFSIALVGVFPSRS